jgi:hypothetical protein
VSRYEAREYSPEVNGPVIFRVMPQLDVPRRLLFDMREGREVRSGPVRSEQGVESVLTIIWGGAVREDGTRKVLAWYEMDARGTVSAQQ